MCRNFLISLKSATVLAVALCLLGTLVTPSSASTLTLKSDSFLAHYAANSSQVRVIVALSGGGTPAEIKQLTSLGGDIYRHLSIIHSVALSIPSHNLDKLANLSCVARISTDLDASRCDEFTDDNSGAQSAYTSDGLTGKGVTVAVLDSGIHSTADFNNGALLLPQSRIVAAVNFVPTTTSPQSSIAIALSLGSISLTLDLTNPSNPADDTCGHGTHVSGIIAGNGSSSSLLCYKTFDGVARDANLVNVRVLDGNGVGSISNVIAGVQWIVAHKAAYNIRVLNCSLGYEPGQSYTTDPVCQAMEAAWKAGIVVVCAAGNNGRETNTETAGLNNSGYGTSYGTINAPGNDPYVITVGAMKQMNSTRADDEIASYSSRGPSRLDYVLKPDICAPGNQIISVEAAGSNLATNCATTNQVPYGSYQDLTLAPSSSSNNYFILSGTSMATPVVSGAAALMLQANPNLTPDTIKARLMVTADKWTEPDGSCDPLTFGAGYIDIMSALSSTVVPTEPALSPTLYVDANGNVDIYYDGTVWSDHAIWGCTTVGTASTVYGNHAIWGCDSIYDDHAIWGMDSVWSDHAIWGCSTDSVDLSSVALNGD
jgi:serine protease AprX